MRKVGNLILEFEYYIIVLNCKISLFCKFWGRLYRVYYNNKVIIL